MKCAKKLHPRRSAGQPVTFARLVWLIAKRIALILERTASNTMTFISIVAWITPEYGYVLRRL